MEKEPDNPDKLHLNLNGMNILEWFRQKYQVAQRKYDMSRKPETNKNKRIKM
jgi:hypothetical protein